MSDMASLWGTLVPLVIGSAIVPVQILVTVMLLRSSLRTAAAWVAGMAAVRVAQGIVFGVVLADALAHSPASSGPGLGGSTLLLVFAVLFYVTALSKALTEDDPDAPPPRWMEKAGSMSWPAAFGIGAGYVAISPKFWVFTLGALAAIAEAPLGGRSAALTYVEFVVLALSTNLAILGFAAVAPARSASALERFSGWLQSNDRIITVVLGVVFGTWFMYKALGGFGIL